MSKLIFSQFYCWLIMKILRFNTFISFYPRFSHKPDIHFKHMIVLLRSMLMKNNSNHAWQVQFYIDSTKESRVWDLRDIVCGDLSLTPILIKEEEKINWVIYFRGFKIMLALERPWSNLRLILNRRLSCLNLFRGILPRLLPVKMFIWCIFERKKKRKSDESFESNP